MNSEQYKALSIREFTKAAKVYDSGHSGIYEMCKDDYPMILEELRKIRFESLLDAGCGTGPMIELLCEEYPDRHYTGLDLTPAMIEKAKEKNLANTEFLVGDSENMPFEDESFDVIICANSFHHYPEPERFFAEVQRVLKPEGVLILRDYTSYPWLIWLMNHIEMPLAHLVGHGDVRAYTKKQVKAMVINADLTPLRIEGQKKFRLHLVAKKN